MGTEDEESVRRLHRLPESPTGLCPREARARGPGQAQLTGAAWYGSKEPPRGRAAGAVCRLFALPASFKGARWPPLLGNGARGTAAGEANSRMPSRTVRLLTGSSSWPRREIRPGASGTGEAASVAQALLSPATVAFLVVLLAAFVAGLVPPPPDGGWTVVPDNVFTAVQNWLAEARDVEAILPAAREAQGFSLSRSVAVAVMLVSALVAVLHSAAFAGQAAPETRSR